ncbi:hypothetical protein M0811_06306 [Anaeramoeba ignava]|uniref:Uncharacterized protein n=1 Tax=Anaeramoeba ignava TaxID=1746090 RepID=A0A9Q0LNY6_ANAIG|nr:hypothetical protein M0811_06306 [Anaeramoeba ignava]
MLIIKLLLIQILFSIIMTKTNKEQETKTTPIYLGVIFISILIFVFILSICKKKKRFIVPEPDDPGWEKVEVTEANVQDQRIDEI